MPTTTTHTTDLTTAERRYQDRINQLDGKFTSWRTPARRRLLVTILWAGLGIMAGIAIGGLFWFPIVLAWIPMTIVLIVAWTMLRVAIDCKDTAPMRFLDEFEVDELLKARSTAFAWVSGFLFVISMVLIIGSSFELGDGHRLAYAMGGVGIVAYLVGGVIPASRMARLQDEED